MGQQAWFTHTSELITGPKPKQWHAPSGNAEKIDEKLMLKAEMPAWGDVVEV